eukprot:scaffold58077_cov63-Phaeocystis_antarctica.AAC.1
MTSDLIGQTYTTSSAGEPVPEPLQKTNGASPTATPRAPVVEDDDVVTSNSSPRRARAEVGGARGAAARLARLGAPQVRRARLLGGAREARPLAALAHALGTVARGASADAPG